MAFHLSLCTFVAGFLSLYPQLIFASPTTTTQNALITPHPKLEIRQQTGPTLSFTDPRFIGWAAKITTGISYGLSPLTLSRRR
jgi:hypothetical protein